VNSEITTRAVKENNYLKSKNMNEFIYEYILPKWEKVLASISKREREQGIIRKGEEFAWKQFLNDIQKFYRLIFKHRFHRLDKRDDSNSEVLAERILSELGIKYKGDFKKAFHYFYPVLFKLRKYE